MLSLAYGIMFMVVGPPRHFENIVLDGSLDPLDPRVSIVIPHAGMLLAPLALALVMWFFAFIRIVREAQTVPPGLGTCSLRS